MKLTVEMDVTKPQALALTAMFEHWNFLSSIGSSRNIAFHCDGDGNFHPHCKIKCSEELPDLTDEMRKISVVKEKNGDRVYDFDPIAWKIRLDTTAKS